MLRRLTAALLTTLAITAAAFATATPATAESVDTASAVETMKVKGLPQDTGDTGTRIT
ncbi:hypothetical protein J4H86_12825 [Spiractinospora alimapuensis]|uniref:hypothetical protein n=1 Tax=Spiractinospora alimapuensis TaxID=2820884 RepID=UPI001F1CDC68|nr:hypothetical protein [Spiractinospora alimapuensis]QVQ54467.1 hypothetical protein J4H86_12825 [Spiractinospora alimapuensis]